jgi:signal transduction histidine kinase
LYDFSPVGYFTVSEKGIIEEANLTAATLLGTERSFLVGIPFSRFIMNEDQDIFYLHWRQVLETKTPQTCRLKLTKKEIGPFDAQLESLLVKDGETGSDQIRIVTTDVTSEKEAEDNLKKAYERLEDVIEQRTKELVEINLSLKKTDQRRQLLSKELIRLLEKDRHQVAMELHDHIGQGMTSLKIALELAQRQFPDEQSDIQNLLKTESKRVSQLLKDIKDISQGLRPSTLDKLGLVPSLQNLFNELKDQEVTPIIFFVKNLPKQLTSEIELAIFRIVQESINNIQKHARAETIHVNLIERKGVILVSIEDNGSGFDLEKAMEVTKGKMPLGLLIMRERAEQIGGEFSVDTKIGRGTIIMAEIPI